MNPITTRSAIIDISSPHLHAMSLFRARTQQPDAGVHEAHPNSPTPCTSGTERSTVTASEPSPVVQPSLLQQTRDLRPRDLADHLRVLHIRLLFSILRCDGFRCNSRVT
jgi:hypothetical protein